ncbi:hypothetical protein AMTRI_Chr09g39800 [Amborella trichopoda]
MYVRLSKKQKHTTITLTKMKQPLTRTKKKRNNILLRFGKKKFYRKNPKKSEVFYFYIKTRRILFLFFNFSLPHPLIALQLSLSLATVLSLSLPCNSLSPSLSY